MNHVVLLGDSIFDNGGYVPGGPSVIEHLHKCLPAGWRATLLAVDGAVVAGVLRQFAKLPPNVTHLVVSVGGNDALASSGVLHEAAGSAEEVLSRLADVHEAFQQEYRAMLESVAGHGKPVAVCTIYDAIPGLAREDRTGLCLFNDVILREASRLGVPVLDLRTICADRDDFALTSPIEPSVRGGAKIARAISRVISSHEFGMVVTQVYA